MIPATVHLESTSWIPPTVRLGVPRHCLPHLSLQELLFRYTLRVRIAQVPSTVSGTSSRIVNPRPAASKIHSIGLCSHADRIHQPHVESPATISSIDRLPEAMPPSLRYPRSTPKDGYYSLRVAMWSAVPSTSPQTIRGERVDSLTRHPRSVGCARTT